MSATSTRVLLDVDGVINALGARGDRKVWTEWRSGQVRTVFGAFDILFSPAVVEVVASWARRPGVEVCWLSDWGLEANISLRRLTGLPCLRVVPAGPPRVDVARPWWKGDAAVALEELEPSDRLVWIDDDLRYAPVPEVLKARMQRLLLVQPPRYIGLAPKHISLVEAFLRE